jgi:hypothetical protein
MNRIVRSFPLIMVIRRKGLTGALYKMHQWVDIVFGDMEYNKKSFNLCVE